MIHTDATRHKLSAMRKGEANPFFGKKHSSETLRKMSLLARAYNANRTYSLLKPSVTIPTGNALAYFAGIIDGEGSIRFSGGRPFVAVYNSDPTLKEWVGVHTGITASWSDMRGRVPGWTWRIQAAMNVYLFCKALLPFLIIKQDDARVAIAHLEKRYGGRLECLSTQI